MKFGSIVSFLMIVVGFSGCYIGAPSYEVFAKNMNLNAKTNSPIVHKMIKLARSFHVGDIGFKYDY